MARLQLTLDVSYRRLTQKIQDYDQLLELTAEIHKKIAGTHTLENGEQLSVLVKEAKIETEEKA